ncbi:sodium-dependent neutral amino acid transporter B(0)AT3-like isoform X2 [Nematostella vectensis]|nr:sodium-dependent neutral amino acid transporter B(0)AT3-like isoform X2 [Nematostella vectensis]XP_048576905.1 sodium-dependent neutral amino acid transporter B(0)AT3-like isoform X2 [Nematostella vectensis]XP_048576906.1 sodium-dependent neutral amino acid transporter B(0)AT3-like isoform X2 [Nematostella vectensis]XP_048576907.1 sodium-dependent neutral amino acid transporter B(0)AT3-like isoform X2 [Nematostella vectensis]
MAVSNNHLTVDESRLHRNVSGSLGLPDSDSSQFLNMGGSRLEVRALSGSISQNGYGFGEEEEDYQQRKAKFKHANKRERWNNRTEFLLTLVGYTIGLGNVWRFPHLCHKNGGASFLIPYGIMLAVEGIPLYYMELCIGQRMRKGSIGVWNEISPYLGGVGIASVVVCFLVCLYYNVVISWCVFYFVQSFQSPLPWAACPTHKVTIGNITRMEPVPACDVSKPTEYFWYRTTLGISSGIEDGGGMNWKLWGCLVATWILVWLCMCKGIKVTGKIVYITATLPLILLIIFFFRGVHLDGYQDGLRLLFVPEFNRLKDPLVWLDAAVQIFYSLGVAYGSLIAFSSYNPMKNDSTRDAITVCFVNCATSIYASIVVFCFIGFQAQDRMNTCLEEKRNDIERMLNVTGLISQGMPDWDKVNQGEISDVIKNASVIANETLRVCNKTQFLEISQGQGLAFIVFTDAINKMPLAPVWAVMFFLMLITVGIDTEFGMLEGVVTPIRDMKLLPNWKKEYVSGLISLVICVLGFPLVQHSGEYWVQLVDGYCSGIPLLIIALVECIAISYIYGIDRFSDDIQYMTNKPPRFIWKWCWKVISPLAILAVLGMSIKGMSEGRPSYSVWNDKLKKTVSKPLPPWGVFLGIMLTLCSIFFIPAVAFLRYFGFIGMGTPTLPDVVLSETHNSETQPLYQADNGKKKKKKKGAKTPAKTLTRKKGKALNGGPTLMVTTNGTLPTSGPGNGDIRHLLNHNNGTIGYI